MRDPIFVNYFRERTRDSCVNLAVARVLVAGAALWKLLSYDFADVAAWPAPIFETDRHAYLFPGEAFLPLLPVEVAVAALCLLLFGAGWRMGLTAFASALLLTHLSALHYVPSNSASTWLPFVYALVFLGVYREHDRLRWDARSAGGSGEDAGRADGSTDTVALRWLLGITAGIYFFTGVSKLTRTGLDWASAESLGLLLHREAVMHLNEVPPAAGLLLEHPALLWLSAAGTLVLECGFLVAVLLRAPLLPFVAGLAGMHAVIGLTMEIYFFDQLLIYLLFVRWDALHRWLRGLRPQGSPSAAPSPHS